MTLVAGKVRVNRPYFFKDVDGDRVEFPAFGTGQGDLDGADLSMFNMYVKARQIEATTAAIAPSNVVAPSISGVARVGETLTSDPGEWDGDPVPAIEIQWQADGNDISGETSSTYVPVADDIGKVISIAVTATNIAGVASEMSDPTSAVVAALAAPVNTVLPVITGTAQVGETLTVSNGTWTGNPNPTYTRRWQADGVNISGATATTYTPVEDDVGKVITAVVTATNSQGNASATSAGTAAVAPADEG